MQLGRQSSDAAWLTFMKDLAQLELMCRCWEKTLCW